MAYTKAEIELAVTEQLGIDKDEFNQAYNRIYDEYGSALFLMDKEVLITLIKDVL